MDNITIEGGEVRASLEDRTISGRLIPFNEEGRTNVGRFMVEAGAVALPADPAIVSLNIDHDQTNVVGRATRVWEQADGIYASWVIANTPEGDAALADALNPEGDRRRLSGEFGPAMIRAGKLVAGRAKVWGSALVPLGAFPSAMVLAADTPDQPTDPTRADADDQHPAISLPTLPADISVITPEGDTALYAPEAAPAEGNPEEEGGSTVTATATEVLAGAQSPAAPVPATLIQGAPTEHARTEARPSSLRQVLAALSAVKANPSDGEARQVLAALTDIKVATLPGSGVVQDNWLGELYAGIPYEREYINLGNLGSAISLGGKKGFKAHRGTTAAPISSTDGIPNGGNWAGDKAEINSYNGYTVAQESFRRNFAVGNDIAREFYDLPGGEEALAAFLRLILEDHLVWSDEWALYDINTMAGAPVAAATYPTDYPAAVGQLIQGILAVKARKADKRRDVPTFAIANDLAYAQLAYAAGGDQHLPAFVELAISTNSNGKVDGNVLVVQGDTGIVDTVSTLVGAQKGIEFDELPGGPLQINALDILHGGIDRATHGYLQTFAVRTEAFVRIGTADAFAQSTAYDLGRVIKYTTTTYRVTTAGTTAASNPTPPAVGATVTSGTAVLTRLA